MKKTILILIGILFLAACSTTDPAVTSEEGSDPKQEQKEITYEFRQEQHDDLKKSWLLPNSYQITVDRYFEQLSRFETDNAEEKMFFWHQPSADEFEFTLETVSEDLEQEVPTMEISPVNKHQYIYLTEFLELEELAEESFDKLYEKVSEKAEEDGAAYMEKMKEDILFQYDSAPTVFTQEDYDIAPFTTMLEHESEQGVLYYDLIGEGDTDYLHATLTIPKDQKEEFLNTMLESLQTITYDEGEFADEAVIDDPKRLSYEASENLKGDYPQAGFSFERPEAATFRYSFPLYHTYRYTFGTLYEKEIEKEHFSLRSSEFIARAAIKENARNREEEMRNRALDDFVAFQNDYARSVTYLHDEGFDTGIFTTGIRVDFDGYDEYWFLKETEDHVYEITFDIAPEAPGYEELLDSYLNAVRTFELSDE
ncbi:hypothetical protein EQV77_06285 [Halobacillus fulvus]|nr:hypothetical protein EQV77_06285 [Halobacillus fulvus]